MAASPRKCKGKEGMPCNCFIPSCMMDYHDMCTVCHVNLRCAHCENRSVDEWSVVPTHTDELQEQCEKERKAMSKSSSFFFFWI